MAGFPFISDKSHTFPVNGGGFIQTIKSVVRQYVLENIKDNDKNKLLETIRFVYNQMVLYSIKYQKQHKKQITKTELISYFFSMRKNGKFKFLQNLNADIVKQISAMCLNDIKHCRKNPYSLIKKKSDNFSFGFNKKLLNHTGFSVYKDGKVNITGIGTFTEKSKKIIKYYSISSANVSKNKDKTFIEIEYVENIKPSILSTRLSSKNFLIYRLVVMLFITITIFSLSSLSYGATVINENNTQTEIQTDIKNRENNEKNLSVINISKNVPRFMAKNGSLFKFAKKSSYKDKDALFENQHEKDTIQTSQEQINREQNEVIEENHSQDATTENTDVNKVNGIKMALPTSIPRTFKCFAYYTALSSNNKVQKIAYTDELGFRKVDNYYTVALGTYYSSTLGDLFHITTKGGEYDVIVTDIKSDAHTDSLHMYSVGSKCMCEFYVDGKTLVNSVRIKGSCEVARKEFSGAITSITYMGNYFSK